VKASGVSYHHALQQWNDSAIEYFDEFYRLRLRSLAAVDELVDAVFAKLEDLKLLDNTYVIYTSDNGYHIGQHRLAPGKTCAWEEDVRVPFFIRGPNMQRNVTVHKPTSHTDIAPTIFNLAGIPLRDDFDGAPIPMQKEDAVRPKVEHINIEFWGPNYGEGKYPQPGEFYAMECGTWY
jgi:N-acetylglucosamine-6-sulfatase